MVTRRVAGRLKKHGIGTAVGHRRTRTGSKQPASSEYLKAEVDGIHLPLHRIIWCLQTGAWPDPRMVIDHLDGNGLNNRWNNLELVTVSTNIRRAREASCSA
jgi:hypothetical protein